MIVTDFDIWFKCLKWLYANDKYLAKNGVKTLVWMKRLALFNCRSKEKGGGPHRERKRDSSWSWIWLTLLVRNRIHYHGICVHLWRVRLYDVNVNLIEGFQQPDPSRPNSTFVTCPFDTDVVCPCHKMFHTQKTFSEIRKVLSQLFRKYILCIQSQSRPLCPEMQILFFVPHRQPHKIPSPERKYKEKVNSV